MMPGSVFVQRSGWGRLSRCVVLGAACLIAICISSHARPPGRLRGAAGEISRLKGKTLVDAINPHTPGYEALDPKDPGKYVGFDIDLAKRSATASASS